MKKAELILIIIILLSFCLSLFLVPVAPILILAVSALSMLYFCLGFAFFNDVPLTGLKKDAFKQISWQRIIGAIATGYVLSVTALGILYNVMLWPGAFIMLTHGLLGALLVGIIAAVKYSGKRSPYYPPILKRVFPYLIAGLFFLFFSQKLFLDYKYRAYPAYVEAFKASRKDPANQELRQKVREEREKMDYHRFTGRELKKPTPD